MASRLLVTVVSSLTAVCAAAVAQPGADDAFPSRDHGRYMAEATDRGDFVAVEPVALLNGDGFRVRIGRGGGMQLTTDQGSYVIDSCFPYPGTAEGADGERVARMG